MPTSLRPIRADVTERGLVLDEGRLVQRLALLPPEAPVVVLIHGWRYAPGLRRDCPHDTILSPDEARASARVVSWPRRLRLDGAQGLAIGLGWQARCGPWRAAARARGASAALALLSDRVEQLAPGRQLQVVAHSMGAQVALGALPLVPAGRFARLILLAAAETRAAALTALQSPAGREVEVVNVATRENDLFDGFYEWGLHMGRAASVSRGLGDDCPRWRDLWIDHPDARAGLARMGFPLTAPDRRICHWSPYLRPGLWPLYRALIEGRVTAADLPRVRPARRWSRLLLWNPEGPWAGLGSGLPGV